MFIKTQFLGLLIIAHIFSSVAVIRVENATEQRIKECFTSINEKVHKDDEVFLTIYDNKTRFYLENNSRNVQLLWNIDNEVPLDIFMHSFNCYVMYISDETNLRKFFEKLFTTNLWDSELSVRKTYTIFFVSHEPTESAFSYLFEQQIIKVILVSLGNCNGVGYVPFYALSSNKTRALKMVNLHEMPFRKLAKIEFGTIVSEILLRSFPRPYIDSSTDPFGGLFLNPLNIWAKKYGGKMVYRSLPRISSDAPETEEARMYLSKSLELYKMDVMAIQPYKGNGPPNTTYSNVVFLDSHMWLVPKPRRLSNIQSIFGIFSFQVWIGILVTYPAFAMGYIFCYKASPVQKPTKGILVFWLDAFKITLGSCITVPKGTTLRVLILSYIIFSHHINYMFQGKLLSFLTVPRFEAKINTMEKMARSNIVPYLQAAYRPRVTSVNDTLIKDMMTKRAVYFDTGYRFDRAQYVIDNRNKATFSLRADGNITTAHLELVDVVSDTMVGPMESTYLFRKGSPLLPSINHVLTIVFEGGFTTKWLTDLRKVIFIPETKTLVSLRLEHTECAFALLVSGLLLGILAFVVELLYSKLKC